jgi:hypothetical protein
MKKFPIRVLGLDSDEMKIWRDAGFFIVQGPPFSADESASPELIWLSENVDSSCGYTDATEFRTSYPKLFFLHSSAASLMPPHWQAYTRQTVQVAGTDWIIGSKLEEPLPPAVAEYLAQQKTAELAAVLYIVILESVFRETAEWCGHMSSVVGRM